MSFTTLQKCDCNRCGFTYKKSQLRRQRGLLLCDACRDDTRKIQQPNPRWGSPRAGSTSTDPVNSPTVYTISAATGISALGQSRTYSQEGSRRHFHMHVVSDGGAITITASPPIVAGVQGDVLTLTGTSDTDTITIPDNDAVMLILDQPVTLGNNDSITFVYNASFGDPLGEWGDDAWGSDWGGISAAWTETSRTKGGV